MLDYARLRQSGADDPVRARLLVALLRSWIATTLTAGILAFTANAHDLKDEVCIGRDAAADIKLHFTWRDDNCIRLNGGFSSSPGSFLRLLYSRSNLLHLGETLNLSSELGVRMRIVRFGVNKTSLFGKPIDAGFTVYAQRFNYNQGRESSIFAFQRNIPRFRHLGEDNLLNYVSSGHGATAYVQYRFRGNVSRINLAYGDNVSDITTLSASTGAYFGYLDFQSIARLNLQDIYGRNALNGIRTRKLIPSFTYDTIDDPVRPTHGKAFSIAAAMAGLGGDVNTIEPTIEAKYFRAGFKEGHVIGMHFLGRLIASYGDTSVLPFDRYYVGGENDVRGFDGWSVSPLGFIPSTANINVLNADGSPRQQRIVDPQTGMISFSNVTMTIPIYQIVLLGGDTNAVTNFEYRIPITPPLALVLFADAGVNRLSFHDELRLKEDRIHMLNAQFPDADFSGRAFIPSGTEKVRMSSGIELQVLVPKINATVRFYCAYNPLTYRSALAPPPVADRRLFPNTATYNYSVRTFGSPIQFLEPRFMFRFSIGRTF